MKYVFVTFTKKLPPEQAKTVLAELRKKMPGYRFIFTPHTPPGKKLILSIATETVILTYPRDRENFTLGDIMKTIK